MWRTHDGLHVRGKPAVLTNWGPTPWSQKKGYTHNLAVSPHIATSGQHPDSSTLKMETVLFAESLRIFIPLRRSLYETSVQVNKTIQRLETCKSG
jgi:hypothetical protein